MSHESDELEEAIHAIFNPEPIVGNEGIEHYETPPSRRLTTEFGLDTRYWRHFEYGTMSPLTRISVNDDTQLATIIQALQVPIELFMGTSRLFAESLIVYQRTKRNNGPYQFYPAILMSACSAFEAYLRINSELLVKTVPTLPQQVQLTLLEKEEQLDTKGNVVRVTKRRDLFHRYWLFLKYGFDYEFDRGSRIWQLGTQAFDKRNELVHYKHSDLPAIKTTELWSHLESLLLLMIAPSAHVRKTIMPNLYEIYGCLEDLRELISEYEERPNFKDWPVRATNTMFGCPFINVDETKYPTMGRRR
jgi:hypothetical protein